MEDYMEDYNWDGRDAFHFIFLYVFMFNHVDLCPTKKNFKKRQMKIIYTLQDYTGLKDGNSTNLLLLLL